MQAEPASRLGIIQALTVRFWPVSDLWLEGADWPVSDLWL